LKASPTNMAGRQELAVYCEEKPNKPGNTGQIGLLAELTSYNGNYRDQIVKMVAPVEWRKKKNGLRGGRYTVTRQK